MRTKQHFKALLMVTVVGGLSWGCQRTTGAGGTGGDESGGSTGSGGASQSGGATGNQSGGAGGGSGGSTGENSGGSTGGKTFDHTKPPCDIYAEDGGPCVAAHSTVRRLSSSYSGPLYQVRVGGSKSGTGGALTDIGFDADGFADGAAQDTACGSEACTIATIYDQSGKGNHLTVAPAGGAKKTPDNEANAKSTPITVSGRTVYGVKIVLGVGYRDNTPNGTAKGDDPQTVYMVVATTPYNSSCCFDYGNAETNSLNNGEGTMEAVYFGNCTIWNKGAGDGPWIMGDLENGLWAGDSSPYENNKPVPTDWKYVTGLVKGESRSATWPNGHWAIKLGNAQAPELQVPFDGPRPSARYNPMRKEGAIILGTGGDNSAGGTGNWFEGLMTTHYSSDAADNAVQKNIAAFYSK